MLVDVELSLPTTSGVGGGPLGPLLWPLNAFSPVGTDLLLEDVRLVLRSAADFKQVLHLLSAQPALQSPLNTTLQTVRTLLPQLTSHVGVSPVLGWCA